MQDRRGSGPDPGGQGGAPAHPPSFPFIQKTLLANYSIWLENELLFFSKLLLHLKKKKKSWNLLAVVCSTFCVNPEKKKCFEERALGGAEGYDHNSLGTPRPREELVN